MVFGKILQLLMGHPQISGRIIQRLADSWPIRRAAKFTAYVYMRGKHNLEQELKPRIKNLEQEVKPLMKDVSKIDTQRFGQTFKEEVKKQWEEAKKQAETKSGSGHPQGQPWGSKKSSFRSKGPPRR